MFSLILKDVIVYSKLQKSNDEKVLKIQDTVYEIFEKCKMRLDLQSDINLIVQDKIKTPSLYGILKPKILITSDVLALSKSELECIFIHELNHYKAKHHYIYLVLLLLKRIYWFNPVIYFADKIIKQDLEYMVDEQVLSLLNDKKMYFKTIIKILAINSGLSCSIPNICNGKIEVERRIKQMKNKKIDTSFSIVLICIIILSLSMLTISLASEKVYTNEDNQNLSDFSGEIISEENDVQTKAQIVKPLAGAIITSTFGERVNPITGEKIVHTGVDVTSQESDEIVSILDGKVILATYNSGRGNHIKIEHADGTVSTYSHGKELLVKEGDEVKAGEKIMIMGATGLATGKHLHFEIINSDGEYVDVNQIFE